MTHWITIALPDKALEELEKKAESEDKSPEELISETVFRELNIKDPQTKAELHLKLCEKYMHEAEEFLTKKGLCTSIRKSLESFFPDD